VNPPEEIIIIGGGEHAKVLAEAIQLQPDRWQLVAIADPRETSLAQRCGVPRVSDDADVSARFPTARLVLGMGQVNVGNARREVAAKFDALGARWATVVHPAAFVAPSARLAEGVVVLPGAIVHAQASAGKHVVINTGAIIEHDVHLGDFAVVSPGVVTGGGVVVGSGAFLGLGCRIRDHVHIGSGVLVAMGAVVIRDVPDQTCVAGVPAVEKRSSP
jgi:acetyltransferase EpsM